MKNCLMFHGIGHPPQEKAKEELRYWLSEEKFARVLDLIRRSPNPVELTFDDGNDSDIRIALPALKQAGLKAAFFISSDYIGKPGYLNEAHIREIHAAGMEIGSHGCRHIGWTGLPDAVIAQEVKLSRNRLGSFLGLKIDTVAAPYGENDLRVLRVLRQLGIHRAYTAFRGAALDGAFLVSRNCITADMSDAALEALLLKKYTARDAAESFLRLVKKTGPAALWRAG